MATERWKVLYLHGWRENADYSRNRCAPLIQALPSFDFDFISAPYRYKNSKRARTWWNATSANKTGPKTYVGMIDTLYYVADMIDRKGPFDGIIGFSQGGVLLTLIMALIQYP
eukprot:396216_1